MPRIPELYRDIAQAVMGMISHPLRGIIAEVPTDFLTNPAPLITVRATPSGASYSRDYRDVPWNVTRDPAQSGPGPQVGDFVTLVFKGGSSEFPVVTAYYPGPNSSQAAAGAQTDRAAVPTSAIIAGAKTPGGSGQAILDFINSGKAQQIIDREGRAACAEFVSNVLKAAGIQFPFTTLAVEFPKVMEANGIKGHTIDQALPGDVICWEDVPGYGANGSGGHIAIYEGNLKISESNHGSIAIHRQIGLQGWHLDKALFYTLP